MEQIGLLNCLYGDKGISYLINNSRTTLVLVNRCNTSELIYPNIIIARDLDDDYIVGTRLLINDYKWFDSIQDFSSFQELMAWF